MLFIGAIAAWSNHFSNGFHLDDFPTILNNHSVESLRTIPRYFTNVRTSSDLPEQAEYRPLLTTTFALDYAFTRSAEAVVYQTDSFMWFFLLVGALFCLFRVIPGGSNVSASVGAFLFALHPATADTVNYVMERRTLIGSLGVVTGLAFWIVWPRMLPQTLWAQRLRSPENWREDVTAERINRRNVKYRKLINLPLGLYLIPVILAMLANPAAAVFAPLLLSYVLIFHRDEKVWRLILPSAVVCGLYFVSECAATWRFDAASRIHTPNYLTAEPWIAAHYLFRFFVPVHLSALSPQGTVFNAIGSLVFAAMVAVAVWTARQAEWKAVSFGLWWFLIGLLPWALVPTHALEANWRMFLPFMGLALAVTRAVWIAFGRWGEMRCAAAVAVVVAVLGWLTYQRNEVWYSEETLATAALEANPDDPETLIRYANVMIADGDTDRAYHDLEKASDGKPADPRLQTSLALSFDRLNKEKEAVEHFTAAMAGNPQHPYARAFSTYGHWLWDQQRGKEAFDAATRAVQIEPTDSLARQTLMDYYSQQFEWADLKQVATETLAMDPESPEAKHSLVLGQSSLDQLARIEVQARATPSVDEYLRLSVLYFQNHRYEDCIEAAKSALKLKPELGEAYANMATAYHSLGRNDDAIAALREVIRLRPDMTFAKSDLEYLLSQKAAGGK